MIDFINCLGTINFYSQCPGLGWQTIICVFTLYRLLLIEISLIFKENWRKFAAKVTRKESETVLISWTETLLNRPKSKRYLYICKLKFRIISFVEECLYAHKVCTKVPLHAGNYNKLQDSILIQSLGQVASLLRDSYMFLLHLTGFFKS